VLGDPVLRKQYDASTEYDIECMAVEEYLARFTSLILTTSGLSTAGGDGLDVDLLSLLPPGACTHTCEYAQRHGLVDWFELWGVHLSEEAS
jgi:hypothetical protein